MFLLWFIKYKKKLRGIYKIVRSLLLHILYYLLSQKFNYPNSKTDDKQWLEFWKSNASASLAAVSKTLSN